jgi:DNA polymerase-1
MARLYDTSRNPGEYSLSKLSDHYHDMLLKIRKCYLDKYRKEFKNDIEKLKKLEEYELFNNGDLKKIDMKILFRSKKVLKSGDEGKSFQMPDLLELHTDLRFLKNWITYSVLDAEVTYYLRDTFQQLLQTLPISSDTHFNPITLKYKNNYDIYMNYWRPFGEALTDMEREGIKVNCDYLRV